MQVVGRSPKLREVPPANREIGFSGRARPGSFGEWAEARVAFDAGFRRRRRRSIFSGAAGIAYKQKISNRKTKSARSAKAKSTGLLFAGIFSQPFIFLKAISTRFAALESSGKPRAKCAYLRLKLRESLRDRGCLQCPASPYGRRFAYHTSASGQSGNFFQPEDGISRWTPETTTQRCTWTERNAGEIQSRRCRFAFERFLLYDLFGVLQSRHDA